FRQPLRKLVAPRALITRRHAWVPLACKIGGFEPLSRRPLMPRMNVLNTVEREAFDSPAVFNSFQRKQYFDFPPNSSMRWPTARRLPGGTSTCSVSTISRKKSYGTAWEFGSQN